MLRLAFRLFSFNEHLAFEHLIVSIFNKRLPQVAYLVFNLLLEVRALWIVLGDVFQSPTTSRRVLSLQDLVGKDVGATNAP